MNMQYFTDYFGLKMSLFGNSRNSLIVLQYKRNKILKYLKFSAVNN